MKTIPGKPYRLDLPSRAMQRVYRRVARSSLIPSPGLYNLSISHSRRFIWFRVAKVGTRTVLNHLQTSGVELDVEHASWTHYPVAAYCDYFKFAFVRNPWDRLLSCWRNKVVDDNYFEFDPESLQRMQNFGAFIDYVAGLDIARADRHLRLQAELVDLNSIDYLGRMENFDSDLNRISRQLRLPERDIIVRKNVTVGGARYCDAYDEGLAGKVAEIYRRDIQIFGYQF